MNIKEYVLNEIVPLASAKVIVEVGTKDVQLNQMPYLVPSEKKGVESRMKEISLEIAIELEKEYEKEMKEEFLNLATMKLLTERFIIFEDESNNALIEERNIAQTRVKEALEKYSIAAEAVSYLKTIH